MSKYLSKPFILGTLTKVGTNIIGAYALNIFLAPAPAINGLEPMALGEEQKVSHTSITSVALLNTVKTEACNLIPNKFLATGLDGFLNLAIIIQSEPLKGYTALQKLGIAASITAFDYFTHELGDYVEDTLNPNLAFEASFHS